MYLLTICRSYLLIRRFSRHYRSLRNTAKKNINNKPNTLLTLQTLLTNRNFCLSTTHTEQTTGQVRTCPRAFVITIPNHSRLSRLLIGPFVVASHGEARSRYRRADVTDLSVAVSILGNARVQNGRFDSGR